MEKRAIRDRIWEMENMKFSMDRGLFIHSFILNDMMVHFFGSQATGTSWRNVDQRTANVLCSIRDACKSHLIYFKRESL